MNFIHQFFNDKGATSREKLARYIETMLVMIAADGVIEEAEMALFMAQLKARPELESLESGELEGYITQAFDAIKRDGLNARLGQIALELSTTEERIAALSMATAIAVEDGQLAEAEGNILRLMQRAFDLSDIDVERAVEMARQAREQNRVSAAATEAYLIEYCYVEVLLLMAAADGVLEPVELEQFSQQLVDRPEFGAMTADQLSASMDSALRSLQRDGLDRRLKLIAQRLTTQSQRLAAFRMALEMCIADGSADPHERTLLKLLQENFRISDEKVAAEINKVLGGQA